VLGWVHGRVNELLEVTVWSVRDPVYTAKVLTLAVLGLLHATLVFYLAFAALGLEIDLASIVVFYVLLQLGNYVIVTPGNLGLQEVAFGVLAAELEMGMAAGMLVSGLIRATGYVSLFGFALPMGGVALVRQPPSTPG